MKTENKPTIPQKRSWLRAIQLNWQPQPLIEPRVDVKFVQMDQLQRTAEVLRYSIRRFEWWLSPGGRLREWLRFNLVIATVLSIPALLIVPPITYLLGQFGIWSALLGQIASKLIILIIGIALLSAAALLIRLNFRR